MPAVQPQSDERLAAIAALAAAGAAPSEIIGGLLQELAADSAVHGGGLWGVGAQGGIECRSATGPTYQQWLSNGGQGRGWTVLRQESLASGERRLIPCPPEGDVSATINPDAGGTLVHWPLSDVRQPQLIELLFAAHADDAGRRAVLQLLQRAEQYCADNPSADNPSAASPTIAVGEPSTWDAGLLELHRSLRLSELGFAIANEGRRLIGCDRVCVLVNDGARLRLTSVSGVDLPDRRSNVVRAIEAAAAAVASAGRVCIYRESAADDSSPLAEPLAEYADACHVRSAMFVPLLRPDAVQAGAVGMLLAEWFTQTDPEPSAGVIERVAMHASVGLANALEHAEVAWARALLPVQWVRSLWLGGRNRWTTAVLIVVGLAALALAVIPAPLVVTATGELQPSVRQHVYSPLDGIVEEVLTTDDADVVAGETLVRLSNSELEFELQRVIGAIETWQEKLSSIGIMRLDGDGRRGASQRAAGEEAEIRQELESLRIQRALLEQRQTSLSIVSPIAGRVVTWNVREELADRPVRAGDRLLTVADINSPWELELRLAERDAGHVAEALQSRDGVLDVEFMLASRPEATYPASLSKLSDAVLWDRDAQVTTPATAEITGAELRDERPGSSVRARIRCGRRSLGYVWCHSLYEAIVRQLWY